MKKLLLFLTAVCAVPVLASPGDTTKVTAHNRTDMTWYGAYDTTAVFPDGSKTYNKILLRYTMGCATGGCSDWDYTTQIVLMHKTGVQDSSIAGIDTISVNPLQIDTSWNVFEVTEPFELGRVITPYGGNLSNNWSHTFTFDVTDYYSLLKDSVTIRAFYSGWSSGFSATTEFIFIEGTPPRKVISIDNIYQGYFDYISSSSVEANNLPEKQIVVAANTQDAVLRVIPTGHGFVNSLNCAEFCKKDYYVKVNNQLLATQSMWRDDCGLNPVWPQAGTWLYDRANWCPGAAAIIYNHSVSSALQAGSTAAVNIDIEPYSYIVPQGETPAGYYFTAQLIQYENKAFTHEVELVDILAPSNTDEYGRMNPVCGKVVVEIRNNGSAQLNSCTIEYGIEGGRQNTFNWTGNLDFMESEVIEIPIPDQADWETYTGSLQYEVRVKDPNGANDEVAFNNNARIAFTPPPVYPANLKLLLKTNNKGSETFWALTSADGTLMASGDNLADNTNYTESFSLDTGCYELLVGDRGKNGLSFFANNDGNGSIILRNDGGSFFSNVFPADFGTEIRHFFTVGLGIGVKETALADKISVYPNPSNGRVQLQFYNHERSFLKVTLTDLSGKGLWTNRYSTGEDFEQELNFSRFPAGIYILKLENNEGLVLKKLVFD